MRTQPTVSISQVASQVPIPPLPLLLQELPPVTDTSFAANLDPHQFTLRATTITVLLKEMLAEHRHGQNGINE